MPGKKFKTLVGRTLAAKKAGEPNGSMEEEGHIRTNQPQGQVHIKTQLQHPSELKVPNYVKNHNFKTVHGSRKLHGDSIV